MFAKDLTGCFSHCCVLYFINPSRKIGSPSLGKVTATERLSSATQAYQCLLCSSVHLLVKHNFTVIMTTTTTIVISIIMLPLLLLLLLIMLMKTCAAFQLSTDLFAQQSRQPTLITYTFILTYQT